MKRLSPFLVRVPRRIVLTEHAFPWRFRGTSKRKEPMSFYPLAFLLFLFCWIVFEMLRIWAVMGGFTSMTPTRGIDIALPEFTVTSADLSRLEAGTPLLEPWVHPDHNPYVVLTIMPSGKVSLEGELLDVSKFDPWSQELPPWASSRRAAEDTVVFIEPLPGITYGSVMATIDYVRSFEVCRRVVLVSYERESHKGGRRPSGQ